MAYGNHRVGRGDFPVGHDIGSSIEEFRGYLVQYLPFIGNAFGQHHIEGRNAVANNHDQILVVDVVYIAHLAMVNTFLSGKLVIGTYNCVAHILSFSANI